jgi:hypothetical protein
VGKSPLISSLPTIMILFINVFIEENSPSPLGHFNSRYNLKTYSKLEVFFYTLESYRSINWSKVYIYCGLDQNLDDHESVYQRILEIFPEAHLYKFRNAYQSEWQIAVDEICSNDDDLIWYAGNHDHPYLAPNNNQLNLIIDALNDCNEIYKGAVYSHYPDNISWIMNSNFFDWRFESKGVCSFKACRSEGIMIVNKALLKNWWFDYHYGNSFIPRADWIDASCSSAEAKIFMPVKLLCHHFDGYTFGSYEYDARDVPPLEIPEGFWENNIIIDYCSFERTEGHTLINPVLPFRAKDENGADLRCMIEDLPLFWQKRIAKINYFKPTFNLKKARNRALYEGAVARRLETNKMLQKGINWGEVKEYRPPVGLKYLRNLFSFD